MTYPALIATAQAGAHGVHRSGGYPDTTLDACWPAREHTMACTVLVPNSAAV